MTTALSVLLSLSLIMGSNITSPFAVNQYPANVITTPYGTCTWYYSLGGMGDSDIGSIFQGMTFGSDVHMTVVNYSFGGSATGTFDLPVYDNVLNNNYKLFVEGGMLLSVPDTDGNNSPDALRFRVNNTKQFTCLIIHPNWTQSAVIGLSLLNQNITIGDTIEDNVEQILSYTEGINGYAQTINSNTNTIKNILAQSLGSYVSQGGSLYTDMQTLINAFNVVDNSINNINWKSIVYWPQFNSSLTGSYSNGTQVVGHDLYIKLTQPDVSLINNNVIYKYRIPVRYYNTVNRFQNTLDIEIYSQSGNNYTLTDYDVLYYSVNYDYITLYYRIMNDSYDYVIHLHDDIYQLMSVADDRGQSYYVDENSKVYWEFYSMFKDRQYNELLIEAINNMSLNVNQLTVNATGITYNTNETTVQNNVNNYNDYSTTVNNIENNFGTQFSTAKDNYNMNDIQVTDKIIGTSNFMNNIATQLYGIDLVKYPVALMLLGIVLIGVLG